MGQRGNVYSEATSRGAASSPQARHAGRHGLAFADTHAEAVTRPGVSYRRQFHPPVANLCFPGAHVHLRWKGCLAEADPFGAA